MTPNDQMRQWRNVVCPTGEPDEEIRRINEFQTSHEGLNAARHVRALISRIDPLSHYRAFDNLDFIVEAIGCMDYPGNPAVDVLWRHGQIDEERRALARCYIDALDAWLVGDDVEKIAGANVECQATIETVYDTLGEASDGKRWLAMSLSKTLREYAYTPWDFIDEHEDPEFVLAVYHATLGRVPSSDDLKFRLEELAGGKTRRELLDEILDSEEHRQAHLHSIAAVLKG